MKTKLTVTIDKDLIPIAKKHARSEGVSLSNLIEESLRKVTDKRKVTFSEKWAGKFVSAGAKDLRREYLGKRFK